MAQPAESEPTGRDYGCALVAGVAGLMFAASVVGGMLAIFGDGVSVGLVFSVIVNLLFWLWIAAGAWRRTTWSARGPRSGTDPT